MTTVHEREKLKCNVCDFQSIHKSSLMNHTKTFHSGRKIKFNCSLCVYETIHKGSFKNHMINVHKNHYIQI